ncbi:MAG TPA: DUF1292 domain-containing protein [Pseudoneobacillus sp.]|nr:DUF1292 domain-containing protein [Pseudoneobacillus sp.]
MENLENEKQVDVENEVKQIGMFFGKEHRLLGGIYTLTAPDGEERDFVIVDTLEHDGKEYAFMMPLDQLEAENIDLGDLSESLVVWRISGETDLVALETDEEYSSIMTAFVEAVLGSMSAQASDAVNSAIANRVVEDTAAVKEEE